MHAPHLAGVDLNLLVVLHALLEEQNTTRAARKVGLSQPAVSHALARLRDLLGDPLLVRVGQGMKLTAKAEGLRSRVATVVEDLEGVLRPTPTFDPRTAQRTFRICATDYAQLVLFPALQARVAEQAPSVDIHVMPFTERSVIERLRAGGDGDVAVGLFPAEVAGELGRLKLYEDDFVGLARKGHPSANGTLTLTTYCALSHLLVSPRGKPGGVVDRALARLGCSRRVAVQVPHFLVTPHLVASSDLVIALPSRVAKAFVPLLPLQTFGLPPELAIGPMTMSMVWHRSADTDPAQMWLRSMIERTTAPTAD